MKMRFPTKPLTFLEGVLLLKGKRLKTRCGVYTAAPALGTRRVVIRFASCGGLVVEVVSVSSLNCVVLGDSWRFSCRFLYLFRRFYDEWGAFGARNQCKKRCPESLRIIKKWIWKSPTFITNETSWRFGGKGGTGRGQPHSALLVRTPASNITRT